MGKGECGKMSKQFNLYKDNKMQILGTLNADTIAVCRMLVRDEIAKAEKAHVNCVRNGKADEIYRNYIKKFKNALKDLEQF